MSSWQSNESETGDRLPPHVYCQAASHTVAFVITEAQAMLISGESGAGKQAEAMSELFVKTAKPNLVTKKRQTKARHLQ